MKSLFITLVLLAAAFVAFDYFGNPPGKKIIFKSMNDSVEDETPPVAAAAVPAVPVQSAAPAGGAANAPSAAPGNASAPAVNAGAAAEVSKPQPDATGFTLPSFEPMESMTKGWTMIPASAFPRPVVLKKDASFKMGAGNITVRGGTPAVALAFSQGQVQLAPNASSSARGVVPVDDTDLKELLLTGYEKWKEVRVGILREAHLRRAAREKAAPVAAASPGEVDAGGKPVQSISGSYPLLVAHLKSGEVTELKPGNVHRWGDAVATTWEGKPAYAVAVRADVNTIFGLQPVEAQAIIVGGRVKGWFYSGSGEPVP
jgi:hypothetical protein